MLYVTTRDNKDAHTAYRTLCSATGPDGGLYIPFRPVKFSYEDILTLKDNSFSKCVADVLNLFFSARLDAWDVECCIGRYPVKLVPMSHKIIVAETWNNPDWDLSRAVRNLRSRILGSADTNGCPTGWTWIAVRIAVLFGLFGEMFRAGSINPRKRIDLAVSAGDFTAPMAAWYAREMGLPIGRIIFACDGYNTIWDLLHHGEIQTGPEITPADLERLIYAKLGADESLRYVNTASTGMLYTISDEQAEALSEGLFCAVVSRKRVESVIRSIYRTNTYLLSPNSALAYGGLQDYRATNNETGYAMILTEQGPLTATDTVAKAIGITQDELRARIHMV